MVTEGAAAPPHPQRQRHDDDGHHDTPLTRVNTDDEHPNDPPCSPLSTTSHRLSLSSPPPSAGFMTGGRRLLGGLRQPQQLRQHPRRGSAPETASDLRPSPPSDASPLRHRRRRNSTTAAAGFTALNDSNFARDVVAAPEDNTRLHHHPPVGSSSPKPSRMNAATHWEEREARGDVRNSRISGSKKKKQQQERNRSTVKEQPRHKPLSSKSARAVEPEVDDDHDSRLFPAMISTIAIAVESGKRHATTKHHDETRTRNEVGEPMPSPRSHGSDGDRRRNRLHHSATSKGASRTNTTLEATAAASLLASLTSSSSDLSPSHWRRRRNGGFSSLSPACPQKDESTTATATTYVHRPATMRTISGLGMEDPVGGAVRKGAAKSRGHSRPTSISEDEVDVDVDVDDEKYPYSTDERWYGDHPSMTIFDDMSLGAVPKDMQDLVTVASDPTADTRRGLDATKFAACLPNFDPDAFAKAPPVPTFVVNNDRRRRSDGSNRRSRLRHEQHEQLLQRRHSTDGMPMISPRITKPPAARAFDPISPKAFSSIDGIQDIVPPTVLLRQVSSDAVSLSLEDLQRSKDNFNTLGAHRHHHHASGTTMGTSSTPASDPQPHDRSMASSSYASSPRSRRRRSSLDHALARKNRMHSSSFATFETSWTGNTRASTLSVAALSVSTLNTNQVVAEAAQWALYEKKLQDLKQQQHEPHQQSPEISNSQILVLPQELIDGALAAVASTLAPSSPVDEPSSSLLGSPRFSLDLSRASTSRRSLNRWKMRGHLSDSDLGYATSPSALTGEPSSATQSKKSRDSGWLPSTATTTSPSSVDDDDHYSRIQEQRQRLLKTLLHAAPLPIQEETTQHSSTVEDDVYDERHVPILSLQAGKDPSRPPYEDDAASDVDDDFTDLILLRVSPEDEPEAEARRLDPPASDEWDDRSQGSGETIEVVVMVVNDDDDEDHHEFDKGARSSKYGTAVSSSTASCDSIEAQQLKEHVISLYLSGHASSSTRSGSDGTKSGLLSPSPSQPHKASTEPDSRRPKMKPASSASFRSSASSNGGPSRPPYPSFIVPTPSQDVETAGALNDHASVKPRRMSWSHRSGRSAFQYPETHHHRSPLPVSVESEPALASSRSADPSMRRSTTRSPPVTGSPPSSRRRESLSTTLVDSSPSSVLGTKRLLPVSMASLFPEG